jgi:hypothetical protein
VDDLSGWIEGPGLGSGIRIAWGGRDCGSGRGLERTAFADRASRTGTAGTDDPRAEKPPANRSGIGHDA